MRSSVRVPADQRGFGRHLRLRVRGNDPGRVICGGSIGRHGSHVEIAARRATERVVAAHRTAPFGTQALVTYTCVGETVNLAAHLEAHTKVLGRPILIDENTRNGLGKDVRVDAHGPVQLKTRSHTVEIYSVPARQ